MSGRRTVRKVAVVIETEGLSDKEHERRVTWVEKNIQDAARNIDSAFVSLVVYDEAKEMIGFFGSGKTPSEEIIAISEELVADG